MQDGSVEYTIDNLGACMKVDIFEHFDSVVGDFAYKVDLGKDVSIEELRTMREDLVTFRDAYNVKALDEVINTIDSML